MPDHPRLDRRRFLLALLLPLALAACARPAANAEQDDVRHAFDAWKTALVDGHAPDALGYIPRHVDDYLAALNTGTATPPAANAPASTTPGVDLLLRTALEKKVPADLRAKLTLQALLQRITDRRLFNPHDLQQITLGSVTVTGDRASAQVFYEGTLTALQLPFVKEDGQWKIDVLAILPYAEVLMRLDRAIKGQTETQQVNQLVAKLPSL